MRELLASTDTRATFAVDYFVYALTRQLGALAATLGGLDALVSRVSAWVIPTNEELMIARHTVAILGGRAPRARSQ